ncbi:reverse transcriptase domain-containing protein [Tanacetum coccineum]
MPTTRSGMTSDAIEQLIAQPVAEELAARGTNQNNRNGDENGNGNRIGPNDNVGGTVKVNHVCTYKDFLNCQPRKFSGTKGVIGLTRWFEKMKYVFCINNCTLYCQVKFATCTLLDSVLTWWNSHVKMVGIDAAYGMPWTELMKLMTEVYCPWNEIQKMENELWNLTVKGTDIISYTQRFQELALMCPGMVPDEEKNIERMASSLMDQKVRANAARQAENKRK